MKTSIFVVFAFLISIQLHCFEANDESDDIAFSPPSALYDKRRGWGKRMFKVI